MSVQRGRVCILVGMAGSGKTSLLERLVDFTHAAGKSSYVINLDPAAHNLPYQANIDIRDTIDYKAVMKEYSLGPNGAILTAANLFATRFDKVISICEQRATEYEYFFVDTPGQIEIFTWSASGMMITEMIASSFSTDILFVMDTPQCQNPQILMSNMLQAVSVLYRSRLNVVLVFNKIDVAPHAPLLKLLTDVNIFQEKLENASNFSSALTSSLNLILQEFYEHLNIVGVSAIHGTGIGDFVNVLQGL